MSIEQVPFILTPSLNGLIQQLMHLSQFGADALAVEGQEGAGKTSLASYFCQQLKAQESREFPIFVASVISPPDSEHFDVLFSVANALGVAYDGDSSGELISRLRSFVQALFREKRLAIVVIDDAENLSSEALGALLSLLQNEPEGSFGVKFVFFSEPGFVQRVDEVGLFDLAVYDFQMPQFSAVEIEQLVQESYPEYQEKVEKGELPASNTLWRRSSGLPGLALGLVSDGLFEKRTQNLTQDIRKMPILHLVVVAVLLSGLILMVFYGRDNSNDVGGEVIAPKFIIPESELSAGPTESQMEQETATLADQGGVEAQSFDAEKGNSEAEGETVNVLQPMNTIEPDRLSGSAEPGNDVSSNELTTGSSLPAVNLPTVSDTQKEESPELSDTPEPEQAQEKLLAGERELLGQVKSGFVLQMLAASQKASLEQFISVQENKGQMKLYRKRRDQGGTWYVVVIGPFPNKSEAQRAILNLPPRQKKAGPWPRNLADVQAEIRDYHGL